ncbi:MAG: hypothetical protein L0Y71_09245 [Gemmataceae bacterium]|nr:hypothetical protein [Gemmataceae bacterium]
MNGFIRRAALGTCLGASVVSLAGCVPAYRELVDPCWPERYNHLARQSVRDTFNAQAANGHVFDQTIWTEYFDLRNATELNDRGRERLRYIALRKPVPDPRVYVQKTGDAMLDFGRKAAVEKQLGLLAQATNPAVGYQVELVLFSENCLRKSRRLPSLYEPPDKGQGISSAGIAVTGSTGSTQGSTATTASGSSAQPQ